MDYTTVLLNNRISITMDDYIKLIKKYIDTSTISTIVDAGSMDGSDALLLKHAFSNSVAYAIEGLPNNYNNYIKDNTEIIGINCVIASYDGEITYYEKNINGIHGIYDRGSSYGTHTLTLPCCKFATIINKYNIPTSTISIIRQDTYPHISSSNYIFQTKILTSSYSGDLITFIDYKTTNIFSDLRSYCYRWSGKCYCKMPCKYKVSLLNLLPINNKLVNDFKDNKKKEMLSILHNISATSDYLTKNIPINSIMKTYYNAYVEYIEKNNMSYSNKTIQEDMLKKQSDSFITEDKIRNSAKSSYIYSDKIITLRDSYSDITICNYKKNMNGIVAAYNKYYDKDLFKYPDTLIYYPNIYYNVLQ